MDEREIPEYSVSEIESKAEKLLQQYNVPGDYVEIEVIAEKHLGLEIIPFPNIAELYETEGIFWKTGNGECKIGVDQRLMDRNPNRYRFTVAEEVAHFVLHREFFDEIKTLEDAAHLQNKIANYENADRNAKRLAAALLMPAASLREHTSLYYSQIVGAAGFGDPHAVKRKLTSILAKQFQVSFHTMEIRLGEWPVNLRDNIDEALKRHLLHLK